MFYATFKGIGKSDITAFKTEKQRDDWVNFKDEISLTFGINENNTTFGRKPLKTSYAEKRIKTMLHKKDDFNDQQEWYVVKEANSDKIIEDILRRNYR